MTNPHRPSMGRPSQERIFGGEVFELINHMYAGQSHGSTKREAEDLAAKWRTSYPGSKARIVKWHNKYWVYGN